MCVCVCLCVCVSVCSQCWAGSRHEYLDGLFAYMQFFHHWLFVFLCVCVFVSPCAVRTHVGMGLCVCPVRVCVCVCVCVRLNVGRAVRWCECVKTVVIVDSMINCRWVHAEGTGRLEGQAEQC